MTESSTARAMSGLLIAAKAGDEHAFVQLTGGYREPLHRHCYRLLGSVHDADDALQETMLRAWRGLASFEPHAPILRWLYRIATNVSLRMIEQRNRREHANVDAHLEPYPARPVDALPSLERPPDVIVEEREAVALAFVAAMQLLPPKQRVALVLRDVLGWSAREVADLLDDTTAAVNSALQRARARLEAERAQGTLAREHRPASGAVEAAIMRRFEQAWDSVDIEGILALLAHDALLTMPPEGVRVQGAAEIASFFATEPLQGRLDRIRLVGVRANGQPALAAYAADDDPTRPHRAYGVMVFAIIDERIAGITGFPDRPILFSRLGLPTELVP